MLWSGSSPSTVARGSMWGFLMFGGAAWLAIAWAVMRLEPSNISAVAGPMILFGAVCELVRALAGTRTWWINAGLAVLFAGTGAAVLTSADSTFTTPASLVGWYLMVRGAMDIAVGIMTRGTDRVWGLIVTIGVLETGLGYFSASPFSRAAEMVIVVLGAMAVLRAVADLVTALRLREVSPARRDVLELPPERADGVTGYSAGMTDFETAPARARHRAPDNDFHDQVVRTTADLDAMLVQAGVTGPREGAPNLVPKNLPVVPDTPEGVAPSEEVTSAGRSADRGDPGGR